MTTNEMINQIANEVVQKGLGQIVNFYWNRAGRPLRVTIRDVETGDVFLYELDIDQSVLLKVH